MRAGRVPGTNEEYTVVDHGNADGLQSGVTPEDLAKRILRDPDFYGQPVRLYGCNLARGDFPQKLADALRSPVIGSPDIVCWSPTPYTVEKVNDAGMCIGKSGQNWDRFYPSTKPRLEASHDTRQVDVVQVDCLTVECLAFGSVFHE